MDVWVVGIIDDDSAARPKSSNTNDEAEGIRDFLFVSSPSSPSMTLISSVDGGGVLAAAFPCLLLRFPRQETMAPTVPTTQFVGGMLGDSRFRHLMEKIHLRDSLTSHHNLARHLEHDICSLVLLNDFLKIFRPQVAKIFMGPIQHHYFTKLPRHILRNLSSLQQL
jgi:hypothetical protein